jgi:hypothetical protein
MAVLKASLVHCEYISKIKKTKAFALKNKLFKKRGNRGLDIKERIFQEN